jgi:copper chaperone CopZ
LTETINIEIVGMSSEIDSAKLRTALGNQPGVKQVDVDLGSGRATVEIEKGTIVEHLLETVEETGFLARMAED